MDTMPIQTESMQGGNLPYDIILDNVSENREEFEKLHENKNYYSGSEVGIICGLSKWKSPLELWAEKTGKITVPNEDNDSKFLGRELEPVIGRLFERRTGHSVHPFNAVIRSKKYPWAIGSPDFFVRTGSSIELGEAKSSAGYWQKEEWGEDKAPDGAQLQLQWYLMLTALPAGFCMGLLGGSVRDFHYPRFERDDGLEDQIVTLVENFRSLVQSDTPPPPRMGDEKTLDDIYSLHEATKVLDDSALDLLHRRKELASEKTTSAKAVAKLTEELKIIDNKLRIMLAGAKSGACGEFSINQKEVLNNGYTVDPFKYTTLSIKVSKAEA